MLAKIKKVYQYGIRTSSLIIKHRVLLWYFASRWCTKIDSYQRPVVQSEPRFLAFPSSLCAADEHADCIQKANKWHAGEIPVLGAPTPQCTMFSWHTDIRLLHEQPEADAQFVSQSFFKDIPITAGAQGLAKDIKVPWELARFQWALLLGHAYQLTGDEMYVATVCRHIIDWIDANPFLRGIHWMNPMEASLRAINWLIALSMIRDRTYVDASFLKNVTSSLYEHYVFIAGNFEWYDGKTSNHYLSDLVGYLYLSWFFGDAQNMRWAIDELEREMYKQILPDGMSYEGSTRYHRLVTELFYYVYLLCEQEDIHLSDYYMTTLQRMQEAMWWCTPHDGELITIGDDDSGVVTLFGMVSVFPSHSINDKMSGFLDITFRSSLRAQASQSSGKKSTIEGSSYYLKEFGLSIYKTEKAHITLRHHAYHTRQPSGHFHNDVGSVTLSVNGIPVIVDPGSYVYTASRMWRNHFRSVAVHNGSYPLRIEPVPLSDSLFFLAQQERINVDDLFCVQQEQYQHYGLLFERRVRCSDESMIIKDIWQVQHEQQHTFCWNFTLHPAITPAVVDNQIQLWYKKIVIATMQADTLTFCIEDAYYAPSYGVLQKTLCVRAYLPSASLAVTVRFVY